MDSDKMDKKNKIILGSGISFASLTILATIVSAFIPRKAPDPKTFDTRTKVAYMATKQFAALPEAEKVKYVRSVGNSRGAYRQLSSTEREKVEQNTRKVRFMEIKERNKKFFQMSYADQTKYLDQMIAQQERWRQAGEARGGQGGSGSNSNARDNSNNNNRRNAAASSGNSNQQPSGGNRRAARQQARYEGMDSTTRAEMSEFFRRLRERRQQTQGR